MRNGHATNKEETQNNKASINKSQYQIRENSNTSRVETSLIEVGTQLQYFDYKENLPSNPHFKSEERDFVPGIFLGYSFRPTTSRFSLGSYFNYMASDVLYDGSFQDGTPVMGVSGLTIFQGQLTVGYSLLRNAYNDLKIYTGLNFREWQRQLDKPSNSSAGSYDEIYRTLSLPIGFNWEYSLSEKVQLGFDFSVGIPLASTFVIIYPGRWLKQESDISISTKLETQLSWHLKTQMSYWINPTFGLILSPFVESISYSYSYIGGILTHSGYRTFAEPASQTYQIGSQFKIAVKI
jgi:hypothetical protein